MNALEFYRLRNDLTQEELGKRIGVSKQTIYKWEKQIAAKTAGKTSGNNRSRDKIRRID